ncbi:hypothetical protein [Allokutzneria sp. NRRL B-24872]|uniref:hypothetical protein n=1 Tax=Allokutzneria sp. NRRL B-24872 TaxID=1137961 RepID=UPI000A3B15BB|nr:hypothetical protein [Allokutzneria sp. NRRL B-24872]
MLLQDDRMAAELAAGFDTYTTPAELTMAVGDGYEVVAKSVTTATPAITTTTLIFSCHQGCD